jgi:hypothetical protein
MVLENLAYMAVELGSSDIRNVLKIAKLCNQADGEEDITRLISIHF